MEKVVISFIYFQSWSWEYFLPLGIIVYTVAGPLQYCRTIFESVNTILAGAAVLEKMQLQEKQVQSESHMQNFTCQITDNFKEAYLSNRIAKFYFQCQGFIDERNFRNLGQKHCPIILIKEERF